MHLLRPCRDYQKNGIRYYLSHQHPALFWQMRMGKSLVVVRAEKIKQTKHILITAPYSAFLSWEEELTLENQSFHIIEGPVNERLDLLDKAYSTVKYVLCSKEAHRFTPEIADYHWDTVIVDEAHCLRNQTAMSKFYQDNFRNADTRCALTGTPAPESELDYYNIIRFLDHNYWSIKNYWGFRKKLFAIVNHQIFIKPGAYDTIAKTLAKHCSVLSRHHVNLHGTTIETVRRIPLTQKVRRIYDRVEQQYSLEINDNIKDTIWATTKHLWLRRLCGGWADQEFISYNKIKELQYLLNNQFKKEQTIIFCDFKKEVKKVCKILQKDFKVAFIDGDVNKSKRKDIMLAFRRGDIQHLVCQPASVKEGANLSNADIEIFYSLPESGNTFDQVKERFIDVTHKGSKLIVYLITEKTVEEVIYKSVKNKYNRAQKMKEYVRYLRQKWGNAA